MELHIILFTITTMSMFFSGYLWRKKSVLGVLASSLLALIPPITDTITAEVPNFGQIITNTTTNTWLAAVSYTVTVWGIGYIVGGINLKKKEDIEDFPRKTVKHMRFDIDDK